MKILVADDDLISRNIMARLLSRSGYEVVTAVNGREAVDRLTGSDPPRLALIDWMMPELDGPGVCREIRGRSESSYTHITLLTSKQSDDDIVAGLQAGADDYLIKPCNPEELKARLRTGVRILDLEDKLVAAREEMRYRATHDALTGLLNRGTILAGLEREVARSQREDCSVSLLLCDLDNFKRVNDVYGHLVGDEIMTQVARCLQNTVRSYDLVGRYGGEEFLILLSGCDAKMTQKRADDIRLAVACRSFETASGPIAITISIGAASSKDRGEALTAKRILNEADQALYRAKANGRNCVELAAPPRPELGIPEMQRQRL